MKDALANSWAANDSSGAREPMTQTPVPSAATADDDLIWDDFDRRMSSVMVTPSSSAIIEVHQFVEEPNIGRHEDPLMWWRSTQVLYPGLAKMAKCQLCMLAMSVPSDGVFSKSGQLICERRTRLTAKNVQMIMFLNGNADKM